MLNLFEVKFDFSFVLSQVRNILEKKQTNSGFILLYSGK